MLAGIRGRGEHKGGWRAKEGRLSPVVNPSPEAAAQTGNDLLTLCTCISRNNIQKGPKPAAGSRGMALSSPMAGIFKTPWPAPVLAQLLVPALRLCQMHAPFPSPAVKDFCAAEKHRGGSSGSWGLAVPGCLAQQHRRASCNAGAWGQRCC